MYADVRNALLITAAVLTGCTSTPPPNWVAANAGPQPVSLDMAKKICDGEVAQARDDKVREGCMARNGWMLKPQQ
jgi:hypothetical protein